MALVALTWVVLAANNVLQALEIRELRRAVIMWRRMAQWPAAGVGFPPLTVAGLDSTTRVVGAGPARSQVIAAFTASCPFCRQSQPEWRSLATRLDSLGDVDMVWLSESPRDSTVSYAAEHQLPTSRVVLEADKALMRAARMRGVPLTLLVDSAGIIRYVHAGVFTHVQADSVLLAVRALRAGGTVVTAPSP